MYTEAGWTPYPGGYGNIPRGREATPPLPWLQAPYFLHSEPSLDALSLQGYLSYKKTYPPS